MGFQLRRHQFVSNVGRAAVQAALYSSPSSQSKSEPMHGTPLLCYEPLRISRALETPAAAIRAAPWLVAVHSSFRNTSFSRNSDQTNAFWIPPFRKNFQVRTSAKVCVSEMRLFRNTDDSSPRGCMCTGY
jgi:hypothetical protein